MVLCLVCNTDATMEVYNFPQNTIGTFLGGSLTFVGAFPEYEAMLVARETPGSNEEVNPMSRFLEEEVKGKIVVIRSDSEGEECDLDVQSVQDFLALRV